MISKLVYLEFQVATELPTYEEAQALSLDPSSFNFKATIPKSPPPAWSPNDQESSIGLQQPCDTISSNELPQPPIYQIFGRASPNRIQRKLPI